VFKVNYKQLENNFYTIKKIKFNIETEKEMLKELEIYCYSEYSIIAYSIIYLQLFNNCKVLKSPKFEAIETNTKRYSIIATQIIASIP
jgi:hypothetical protein